ncbi:MoaD/ThiS family protein [Desulfospira joergensenii]|uniref:MoaD/ThiS family protein n=1 Tax=Desulfospira joergensenii TaxID=53329 RepID=UPI0003B6D938|nr:MoaD/ThiS family protein [Desulfospira joergensenii]
MIFIDLKLFVTLSKYLPENPEAFEVARGTRIEKLMEDLGIPGNSVKLIFVNGKREGRDYCLQDRDRVGLFPPVGGG